MSPQDRHPRSSDAIRARAEELAARGEPLEPSEDLDVLAALIDGTISLDDIDDATLDRCLKARGLLTLFKPSWLAKTRSKNLSRQNRCIL